MFDPISPEWLSEENSPRNVGAVAGLFPYAVCSTLRVRLAFTAARLGRIMLGDMLQELERLQVSGDGDVGSYFSGYSNDKIG